MVSYCGDDTPNLKRSMIEVCDLQKSFGATIAVGGVSFDVRDGETFGLLGPNGAGKSTTIGMLTGAIRPDGGSIRINGSQSPTDAATRKEIGFAPQDLALYEELSAVENVTFFGRLYPLAHRAARHLGRAAMNGPGQASC